MFEPQFHQLIRVLPIWPPFPYVKGFLDGATGKESACNAGDTGDLGRKWQPTAVFLPGKLHGQRSLEGFSPWAHKELDTTEHAHMPLYSLFLKINYF